MPTLIMQYSVQGLYLFELFEPLLNQFSLRLITSKWHNHCIIYYVLGNTGFYWDAVQQIHFKSKLKNSDYIYESSILSAISCYIDTDDGITILLISHRIFVTNEIS